jgi:hypothetical protein
MSPTVRTTLASLALAVPVVVQASRPDLVDGTGGHLLFAASQLLGWLLLASVVATAPAVARAASPRGRLAVLLACGLQVAFAAAYGATALDGEPSEAVFVVFLAGFAALLVGGLVWAVRLRRVASGGGAAGGLAAVALLGALAMVVGEDPLHDVFLVAGYLSWSLVGRGLAVLASRDHEVPESTDTVEVPGRVA